MLTIQRGNKGWKLERFEERCRLVTYITWYAIIGPFHILWSYKSDERKRKTTDTRADEGAGPIG